MKLLSCIIGFCFGGLVGYLCGIDIKMIVTTVFLLLMGAFAIVLSDKWIEWWGRRKEK